MEMERFKCPAEEEDLGAVALVLGLGDALQLHREDLAGAMCGYFEHQRRVQFQGCVAEPLQTITAILPGSKWSCLLLRVVLQDASTEVTKFYPPLKMRAFVDDVTALLMENTEKWLKWERK